MENPPLPHGYETVLDNEARNLSVDHKQLLEKKSAYAALYYSQFM